MTSAEYRPFVFRNLKVGDVIVIAKGFGSPCVTEDTQAIILKIEQSGIITNAGRLGILDAPGFYVCLVKKNN